LEKQQSVWRCASCPGSHSVANRGRARHSNILLRGARKAVPSYCLSTLWKPQRRDPAQLRRKRVKRVSETLCTAPYSPIWRHLSSLRGRGSAMDLGLRIRRGSESSPVNSSHVFLRFVWESIRSLARSSNPHAMRARARTSCQNKLEKDFGARRVRSQRAKHAAGREKRMPRFYCLVFFHGGAPPVTCGKTSRQQARETEKPQVQYVSKKASLRPTTLGLRHRE